MPYAFIQLDRPVECQRPGRAEMWTLKTLVVGMAFSGDPIERIANRGSRDPVWVGIGNVLLPIDEAASTFEFSGVEYFARGTLRRL